MSDDGYTLAETLVALVMIGLAISGLSAGVQVLTRWQMATNDVAGTVQAARRAQASLDASIGGLGPFRSDHPEELRGDGNGFQYDCGGPAPCSAGLSQSGGQLALLLGDGSGRTRALPLARGGSAVFTYRGTREVSGVWPPTDGTLQEVRSISLDDGSGGADPIVVARLWREEPAQCVYDTVMQDCR